MDYNRGMNWGQWRVSIAIHYLGHEKQPLKDGGGTHISFCLPKKNVVCSVLIVDFAYCLFYHAFSPLLLVELSDALLQHLGSKFHEVLQLKQGCFAGSSDSKILEMIKSNSLDVSCSPPLPLIIIIFCFCCLIVSMLFLCFIAILLCRMHQLNHFST